MYYSTVFADQMVGIREAENQIWQVNFLEYDLGYFDKERDRVEPGPSPIVPDKVLTMCPEKGVNHVTGIHLEKMVARGGIEPPTRGFSVSDNSTTCGLCEHIAV